MLEWKLLLISQVMQGVKGHKRNKLGTVQTETLWNPLNFFQQVDQVLVDKFAQSGFFKKKLSWVQTLTHFILQRNTKIVLTIILYVRFVSMLFGRQEAY